MRSLARPFTPGPPEPGRRQRGPTRASGGGSLREGAVFLAYVVGAAWFTFPLVTDLSRAVTDLADPLLNAWAVAWVIHQLPHDPLHLFDANIFYPESGTLAFSENLVGIAVLVAPVQLLLGRPVATHNVGMLLSIALSGYGTYRLVRSASGSVPGGLVAGSVFAFLPYRLGHLSHLQLQAAGFIPLLLLCLGRYLESGRFRHALGVALFCWLTSSSCGYYGVFTWILLGVAVPYEAFRSGAFRHPRRLAGLAGALILSGLCSLPLGLPYMRLEKDFGFHRPLERLEPASARPHSYLSSGAPFHQSLGLRPAHAEQMLFPGLTALSLSSVALFRLNRRTGLYVILGAVAGWASLGPSAGLYRLLHRLVPGVSGLRVPARFSIYVFLALAVLAGFAAASLLSRFGGKKRVALTLLLGLIPLLEVAGRPLHLRPAPVAIPEVYRWLAEQPGPTPVVELPLPSSRGLIQRNARYMLWSTAHFKPLVNGYSALVPPSFYELAAALEDFPSPRGITALRQRGVRFVILHRDLYLRERSQQMEQALDGARELKQAHRSGNETAYEILPR